MKTRFREASAWSRRAFLASAASATALLASGCGLNAPAQVWGVALHDGKPITQGAVVMTPMTDSKLTTWGAGQLDEKGRFSITWSRYDVGSQAGRYGVYIRPPMKVDYESGELLPPPGYPVPGKFLTGASPAIFVDVKGEPMRLTVSFDE